MKIRNSLLYEKTLINLRKILTTCLIQTKAIIQM